jgi:hypothetical protein
VCLSNERVERSRKERNKTTSGRSKLYVLKFVIWRLKILTRIKETFLSFTSPHSSIPSTSGGSFCVITVVAKRRKKKTFSLVCWRLSYYHAFGARVPLETTSLITFRSRVSFRFFWKAALPAEGGTVTTFNKCFLCFVSIHSFIPRDGGPDERDQLTRKGWKKHSCFV